MRLLPILAVLSAIACSGCFNMDVATTETLRHSYYYGTVGNPREHIVVSNYGWYLFNCIPLVCGNPNRGELLPWSFFSDKVTIDVVQNKLTEYAAVKGYNLAELNLFVTDNVLFELPGTSIPIPMPYVLCYHERLISAILLDPPPAKPAPDAVQPSQTDKSVSAAGQPVVPAGQPAAADKNEIRQLLKSIPDGGVK